jgi:hypothetical protein
MRRFVGLDVELKDVLWVGWVREDRVLQVAT